jgi:phage-related tail fiber protein
MKRLKITCIFLYFCLLAKAQNSHAEATLFAKGNYAVINSSDDTTAKSFLYQKITVPEKEPCRITKIKDYEDGTLDIWLELYVTTTKKWKTFIYWAAGNEWHLVRGSYIRDTTETSY